MILTRLERELHRALKSLKQGQLRVARNNGRTRVRRVLRRIEAMLDREYPVIPKAPKPKRAPKAYWQHELALKKRGWVETGYKGRPDLVIPREWVEAKVPYWVSATNHVWVPWWAPEAKREVSKLRELKRSAKARAALFTTKALVP